MNLSKLLLFHAFITFAAGIVLIIKPEIIPATINIPIAPNQYLICYLLGAAELAITFLSCKGRILTDVNGLRVIVMTIILFHLFTAIVELYAIYIGIAKLLFANVIIRIVVMFLFYYYGLRRVSEKT